MTAFTDKFVEILASAIIMLNAGAYSFLWYKIRKMEETITDNSESISTLFRRIFGFAEDSTAEGHLVETEERFDEMNDTLEVIDSKIDEMAEKRKEEHEEVRETLENLLEALSEEEIIDKNDDEFSLD